MTNAEKIPDVNTDNFQEIENDVHPNKKRRLWSMTLQDGYSKSEVDLKLDKIESDMHHGFESVNIRFQHLGTEIDRRFEQVDRRFEQVDRRFEQIDERFNKMEQRFDQFQNQIVTMIEQLDQRWEVKLENYFYKQDAERRKEQRIFFRWLIGFGFMLMVTVLANFISLLFK
ncbi:hypothetical protein JEQ21_02965 [Streptococcus sp. 121]|uniref:hypothetical protein n=1 Tax=Streptococcus sp. 121 TaxID=2797637 RepID=UPI0018F0D516|nr:hypothetical protein [Streptococcus sp. 121]MBJ6745434.1 hypothetical protein [Streptococcus sp. 121]